MARRCALISKARREALDPHGTGIRLAPAPRAPRGPPIAMKEEIFREHKLFRRMLLRRRRNRGVRAAGGDGVLPLPVLQVVGRVARHCIHALEAGTREGDKGSGSNRDLPQDRAAPSPILPNLWRTRDVEASGLGTD